MTAWLPGMKITAARLNDFTATTSTSIITAAAGWSVSSQQGRKVSGVTYIEVFLSRTGAAISEGATNTGNIADTAYGTLSSGWIPQETVNAIWGNGSVDGEAVINTDGTINLRSISGNTGIATSSNVRLTAVWVSENN